MSVTRAHTPAYMYDTYVKWSGARGYIHSHAKLSHIRTHVQTANTKSGVWTGEMKHNNYAGHYPVLVVEKKGATTANSTILEMLYATHASTCICKQNDVKKIQQINEDI